MLTVEEILNHQRNARRRPSEDELRRLPDRTALVYARPSSPHQVQESRESMREIGALVELARADGYHTGIERAEIDAWVEDIRTGASEPGIREDGNLVVVTLDLGISGTLGQERRRGLAHVKDLLERRELGAVYLPEVSRLSRDQDFIEPFVLLRLMKEGACKVRTPDGTLSPLIPRDWETLKDEFDDARQELRVLSRRLHRKRRQRAERGEWVGEPVPPGFVLPVVAQKGDGRFEYGKLQPYPPHAEVARRCLEEMVKRRSFLEAVRSLGGLTFPFFPPEMAYMERLSALRYYAKMPTGYRITPDVVRTLAKNPKLIGIAVYGDADPIPNNHPPAVDEELWLQAHEFATGGAKRRGKATRFQPLDWSGLLYCADHPEPRPMASYSSKGRYLCARDYQDGQGPVCFDLTARFADVPLGREVLRHLRLDEYAEEVMARLEAEAVAGKLEGQQRRREEADLARRLDNLRALLGTGGRQDDEECLQQIRATREHLLELQARPVQTGRTSPADVERVRRCLAELPQAWDRYSCTTRNQLLKALVERVVVRLHRSSRQLEATLQWRGGYEERVVIYLPRAPHTWENRWSEEDGRLLSLLWPSASRAAVLAAFPERTWKGIAGRAQKQGLKRQRQVAPPEAAASPWTPGDEQQLRLLYESRVPMPDIAAALGRSVQAVQVKASTRRLARPRPQPPEVTWSLQSLNPSQATSPDSPAQGSG